MEQKRSLFKKLLVESNHSLNLNALQNFYERKNELARKYLDQVLIDWEHLKKQVRDYCLFLLKHVFLIILGL